jgi:hypothetical protein
MRHSFLYSHDALRSVPHALNIDTLAGLKAKVKVKVMLRPTVCRPLCLGVKTHLRPKTKFLLLSDICGFVHVGPPSLARGRVCRLQLLLDYDEAVIFCSKSRRTHEHILLSQIRDPPTWRVMSPYLYPSGAGWPSYIPGHRVPFSSPPTTRGATVEVFEPASTRGSSEV